MINVGVIGATGYVGVELISFLLNHKKINLTAISSKSFEGKKISEIYENFYNITNLICDNQQMVIDKCDVIFAALPHGLSEDIAVKIKGGNKVLIDIGADFRLEKEEDYKEFYKINFKDKSLHKKAVYSIPELHREKLDNSNIIANPGCYPTSIALAIAPSLKNKLVKKNSIIIDSKSGITGSGRALNISGQYIECNENFNAYAVGGVHRHIPEIEQILSEFSDHEVRVSFTPHLLPISRGILSTVYYDLNKDISLDKIHSIYSEFYKNEKFVKVLKLGSNAKIKNVTHSNYSHISIYKDNRCNRVIICCVIDNMIKGAAGQAIQNMNIRLGFDEDEGINFIPSNF